jgi:protein-S-isoprenylcysteine O-methyltransferase Ste14
MESKDKLSQDTVAKLGSLVVFGLAAFGLVFLIVRHELFSTNLVGIMIQVLAAGLMVWARITFGARSFHATANTTRGKLVTNGPYRLLRHPIYAAIIYFVWAGVLSHLFIHTVVAAVLISVCLIIRMLIEEKFLLVAYEEYSAYSRNTYRLIPFLF